MPRFPKREADVIALADAMIAGYTANPGDFPSADVAGLQAERAQYQTRKDAQIDALAKAQIATEAKDGALDGLEDKMKIEIKQSEVDTAADPEKLELIGRGPKSAATPSTPPGQPRSLDPIIQGPSTLLLDWKAPARGTGGPVRSYIIERREANKQGAFGDWHQVDVSLDTEKHLTNQPRVDQLEYRVIAINVSGQSVPSNTAAVVL